MRSFKIGVVRFLTVIFAMLMLGTSTFAQVSVTIPQVSGPAGSTGTGAITVGDLTGLSVRGFSCTITYDKSVIDITGATPGALLPSNDPNFTVNADLANGKIYIAWAGVNALTGSGVIANLNISYKAMGSSPLTISNFVFNGGTPTAVLGATTNAIVPALTFTAGGNSYKVGDVIKIPINVTAITAAQNVRGFNFVATYNSAIITITGFDQTGTLTAGKTNVSQNNTTGKVELAWADAANITTATGGTVIYLTGKANAAGTTSLNITTINVNDGNPTAGANTPGNIVVTVAPAVPVVTIVQPPSTTPATAFTANEGQTIVLNIISSDPTTTTYGVELYPAGSKLVGNVFTWVIPYTTVTSGSANTTVGFSATNSVGKSLVKNVTITVTNVPMSPVFTQYPASGTEVTVYKAPNPVPYTTKYIATSPEGKFIQYSLIAAPAGASITTSGDFTWVATPDQAGKTYTVTVQASEVGASTNPPTAISTSFKVKSDIVGVVEIDVVPTEFSLSQNYPNPFNPTTAIQFSLPKDSHVKLTVLNILGQEVALLVNNRMGAGVHKVDFDASKLHSGMYIYKIEADNFVSMKKMMLVK